MACDLETAVAWKLVFHGVCVCEWDLWGRVDEEGIRNAVERDELRLDLNLAREKAFHMTLSS